MIQIPAKWFTKVENRSIDLVVIHSMEAAEKGNTATAVANYFARGERKASAHYCVDGGDDKTAVVQCVQESDVAWAAPGANHNGVHIELAGYAKQTGKEWHDPYSRATISRAASVCARVCIDYHIPLEWLSVADLKAGKRGITSHANVSLAFGKSTHTDPGTNFPHELFIKIADLEMYCMLLDTEEGG